MRFDVEEALRKTEGIGTRECAKYRERIFQAHEFLSLALAGHYLRTTQKSSYVQANVVLGELHKRLTLGKRFHGLFIDSPDDDVKAFAKQRSLDIHAIFCRWLKRKGLRIAALRVQEKVEDCDLVFPLADPRKASDADLAAAIARCCCADWWRRQVRKRQDAVLEHVMIELGLVNLKTGIYASNHCVNRKLKQWQRNEEILAALEAQNDLGQVFNLSDLARRGVSNLVNRRNELMTRISGDEAIAKERGDCAIFYTLTAPSRYHAFRSKPCKHNPKYENFSPADTQKYHNNNWAKIRASLKRQDIPIYGTRVVEPHHDGTPHWHLLLFVAPKNSQALTATIKRYCLEESPFEHGAQKRRVDVEHIDPKKGSAVGYIAKYIAKNVDGQHVGEDFYGKNAVESATRIRAWASTWNIRQFQSIGGPSVTAWREARRFANSEESEAVLADIGDDHLKMLIEASDRGDWQAFVRLSGGPTAARQDQPLRAFHVTKDKPNKYGEAAKKLLGLSFMGLARIPTKIREWTVRPVNNTQDRQTFNIGYSIGGANAPPLEFCQ